jgi:hypothetical protein
MAIVRTGVERSSRLLLVAAAVLVVAAAILILRSPTSAEGQAALGPAAASSSPRPEPRREALTPDRHGYAPVVWVMAGSVAVVTAGVVLLGRVRRRGASSSPS